MLAPVRVLVQLRPLEKFEKVEFPIVVLVLLVPLFHEPKVLPPIVVVEPLRLGVEPE